MSYAAAPTSYAAPTASYAAPTASYGSYAMPQQMSYVPPAYGGAPQQPYMNEATIKQQETDATGALNGQADMQLKMISHQYTHQKELLEAECLRNITMATNQFQQQRDQALMSLDQQKQQQEMQLTMAKQQRMMAITQQAMQMSAQAQQQKMQMEMQQKMSTLYSNTAGTGATKDATKGTKKA
jgi:endonuclease/exonuclease/phosphatase (EEP) superfamily protein YafD